MMMNTEITSEHSEKSKKYDRQLRLWGDDGQAALESARICLVNASCLGTEILKSLVLPGIGQFTIVDNKKVTEEDVSSNFFLSKEWIGKARAEAANNFLCELNSDVRGSFIDEDINQVLEKIPSFLDAYNLVIATNLPESESTNLSSKLWDLKIPFITCRSYGFTGMARLQIKEHRVIESHPDNKTTDFRIINPFPELKEYCESFDLDTMELKDHSHLPFVIIIYKYVQDFIKIHGKPPITYSERNQLKDLIRKGIKINENGIPHDEENFEEALKAVNYAINQCQIPVTVKKILDDTCCTSLNNESNSFWVLARALKEFIDEKGALPVTGTLPDMISDTKHYIQLQEIYRAKAKRDSQVVYRYAQRLLRETNISANSVSENDAILFCKHAADLRVLRTSCISYECVNKVHDSSYISAKDEEQTKKSELENPDGMMDLYVVLRSLDRYQSEYRAYPGEATDCVDTDMIKFKNVVLSMLKEMKNSSMSINEDLIHEFCRFGGAELHSVSAFLGGCLAQEVIKLLTRQYVPFNNVIVYNAITSNIETFSL